MGADGHIVIARRADFEAANPDVEPSQIGLYTGTVLGVEACWGYYGDNLFEPNYLTRFGDRYYAERVFENGTLRDATPDEIERLLKAAEWFEGNGETHEVWT